MRVTAPLVVVVLAACASGPHAPASVGSGEALTPVLQAWAAFPIHASPRPIVLVGGDANGPGGFATNDQKVAFIEGAIDRPAHLPAGPATVDGYRIVSADRAFAVLMSQGSKSSGASGGTRLMITHTELGKGTFGTDRGARTMPAWMFTITGADGPVAVLAVAPETFWFPSELAGRGQEPYWAGAAVGSDHRTLTVGLIGMQSESGPCGEKYELKLTESPAAVMVTLIRHPAAQQSPPVACTLMGFLRHASATLKAPLGARVLVDDLGYPMGVRGNP